VCVCMSSPDVRCTPGTDNSRTRRVIHISQTQDERASKSGIGGEKRKRESERGRESVWERENEREREREREREKRERHTPGQKWCHTQAYEVVCHLITSRW